MPGITANTLAIGNAIVALLSAMPNALYTTSATQITASANPQAVTVLDSSQLVVGTPVYVDILNPELVTPTAISGNTVTAVFAQNHTSTWTWGSGQLLYSFTKLGAVTDPTDVVNYAAVTFQKRNTKRNDSGWKVNSTPMFLVETGVDQTDATAAEITILQAADILTWLGTSHILFGGVAGVYVSLVDQDDRAGYKEYPNMRIYRVHHCYFQAVQQYAVQVVS